MLLQDLQVAKNSPIQVGAVGKMALRKSKASEIPKAKAETEKGEKFTEKAELRW